MFLTNDQKHILAVLEKTGWLRQGQILRLLRGNQPRKTMQQAKAAVCQLSHISKAVICGDVVCLPRRRKDSADVGMLAAVDVLLDLSGGHFTGLEAGGGSYKLRFQVEAEDERRPMGVIWVPAGEETRVNASLQTMPLDRTVILALEDEAQMDVLAAPAHSFFAVRDTSSGQMRYYKGGEA